MLILAYLAAIVASNVLASIYGPAASVAIAFLLIGATLTLRDRLHDTYGPRILALLIPLGAVLSLPFGAGRIAIASCIAFAVSEAVDTLVYHTLRNKQWFIRSNASNAVSAALDSLIFPTIAFGAFMWPIVLGEFVAKTCGGAVWSWLLRRGRTLALAAAILLLPAIAQAQHAGPPKVVVQAQAGTMHYPFNNYKPVANAGVNTLVFLPKGFSLLGVVSRDIVPGAKWVGVIALQYRLWSR